METLVGTIALILNGAAMIGGIVTFFVFLNKIRDDVKSANLEAKNAHLRLDKHNDRMDKHESVMQQITLNLNTVSVVMSEMTKRLDSQKSEHDHLSERVQEGELRVAEMKGMQQRRI